jgi:hypothetical protein
MTTATSFRSVDDLRQRLRTMRSAEPSRDEARPVASTVDWAPAPGERVVLVCGCGGSSGATTVALALATAAGRARVVETCGASSSGLPYAAGAELGETNGGWLRGARDEVVIERRLDPTPSPDRLPSPAPGDVALTIIDSSWDVAAVLASAGWLGDLARSAPAVVLVSRATIPGLRRLEAAVELVGEARAVAVTVGAKRWPRPVEQSAGAAVRRLTARERVVHAPEVPALTISGLTPDPLPSAIIRPAHALLTLLEGLQP